MGWGSGSYLLEEVWNIVKKHVPKNKRKKVAEQLINAFEHQDCDTICEVEELCELVHNHEEDEDEDDY